MSDILDKLVQAAKDNYGNNLKSIILYGSKASGEETKKNSDINLILVLDKVAYNDLQALNDVMKTWIKNGNPPPLVFSKSMLTQSADVFPMEFYDIKENHKVLSGENIFDGLQIDDKHLRHECEFELKSKLLKLRQGLMASRDSKNEIKQLLVNSISSILVIFKHVLRLLGEKPPAKKIESLKLLSSKTGINTECFENILKLKNSEKITVEINNIAENYLKEVEIIANKVDQLQK